MVPVSNMMYAHRSKGLFTVSTWLAMFIWIIRVDIIANWLTVAFSISTWQKLDGLIAIPVNGHQFTVALGSPCSLDTGGEKRIVMLW